MAIFDYKNFGTETSVALLRDVRDLVSYAQEIVQVPAPNWKLLSAQELDYSGYQNERGTFYGKGLMLTAQVEISGKYDDQGKLVTIGVTYLGSGGPLGIIDAVGDVISNVMATFNPGGFGKEYPYLAFKELLYSVASYAEKHGLTGADIVVTGASLGGMAVNSMADLSEERWGGFYKDSAYVGIVSPTQSATQKVLNVGAENDPVFRAMENGKVTWGSLFTHDNLGATTTDNIINFNDHYVSNSFKEQVYSVLNPNSWAAHKPSEITTYMQRILDSEFYDLTHQDSTILVSLLSQDLRESTWVQKLGHFGFTQSGPTFTLGTEGNDRLGGHYGTDYIEGGKGDDIFEDLGGYNIILGGEGHNSVNLRSPFNLYDVAYDKAGKEVSEELGTLYVRDITGAISILSDIGTLNTQEYSWYKWGVIPMDLRPKERDVTADGLRAGDSLLDYERSLSGNSSNEHLVADVDGQWLFGMGGNDTLISSNKNVTFVGGSGDDFFYSVGGGANTFLFDGDFGNDRISNFSAGDNLTFIGVHGVVGSVNYHDFATEVGGDTVLKFGDSSVTLLGVGLDSLSSSNVVIA